MPKIIKRRIKKKDVAVEVEVQDRISDIKEMMQQKQKAVITYGAAAAVVILAIVGLLFYRYTNEEKARQLENEAYKIYHNEYQTTPMSKQEQFGKAADLFNQAYAKSKAPRLLLYVAGSHIESSRLSDAAAAINLFLKNHPSEKYLLPVAYQQLAKVQIQMGNKDEALKTLETLYKAEGEIYKDLALIESARLLDSTGKKDEAAAKYKELLEKYNSSPFAEEAKAKLGLTEKKEG